jgi:hypothetical protein
MAPSALSRPTAPAPEERDRALEAAERLARWLDRRYLDPLLGLLLPFVGDLCSNLLGLWPVILAWRRGAAAPLLARMLLNLGVDLLAGSVPVLGDAWDFFFRAHSRNAALLRARTANDLRATPGDWAVLVGAGLFFALALAAPIVLLVLLVRAIT